MTGPLTHHQIKAAVTLALDGARDITTRRFPDLDEFHDPRCVVVHLLRECGAGELDEQSVENLSTFLENLDTINREVARFLMAGLQVHAGYLHHVYDGIEFYLHDLPRETFLMFQEFAKESGSQEAVALFDRWLLD